MAKKPKSENFDALGSVFDFLFTEAKKPPDKRKPIKPTGVAGDSLLTDAIFSSLEMPGAFISDSIINEFNRAITVEVGRIQYEGESIKFTSTNLIDIIKDPEKAINKLIEDRNATRKAQRATYLGGMIDDFITTAWAHKYGNLEAKSAIYGNILNKEKSYEISRAMGQYGGLHSEDPSSKLQGSGVPGRSVLHDSDFMVNRSFDLLGRKVFNQRWDSLSVSEKNEFSQMLSGDKKVSEIKAFFMGKSSIYGTQGASEMANKFVNAVGPSYISDARKFSDNDKINIFDGKLYRVLEEGNLTDKINDTNTPENEREIYRKTLYLLKRDRLELRNSIERINGMLSGSLTPDRRRELKGELKDAKQALRIIDGHTLFGRVGQIEGYYNSLQGIYGGVLGTNLAASILNGKFFDPNQNSIFNPVRQSVVGGVDIFVAKESPHKILGKYNVLGTKMYYLTPRSFFRTIFYNGEGFAFLMHQKIKGLAKIPGIGALSALGITEDQILKGFNEEKDIKLFIENILTKASASLSPKELARLGRLLNGAHTLSKLTKVFSVPFRTQQLVNNFFKARLRKLRERIAYKILTNPRLMKWFTEKGAGFLLREWAKKGGIDVLIKSLLTALVAALGITLTPFISFLLGVLTWAISGLVIKIIGIGLNILKWVSLGIIAILLFIFTMGFGAVTKYNKETLSYRSETPGSIIQCSLYEERDLGTGDDAPWGDTIIPPPSGENCVLGAGSFWCSQGYKETSGWSHQSIPHLMPVDLTSVGYIYAPQFCSTGNCSITRIAVINCRDGSNAGGIVELTATNGSTTYLFKLLHVKPLAGLGEKLSGGQPVAVVQDTPEVERGWCWTGKHLHLETRQNGATVDPLKLLQSFSCNVPDESGCARP